MSPHDQAKALRQQALSELSARKEALRRLLKDGPSSEEDYKLLVVVVAFALAEVSFWEGETAVGKE